VPATALSVPLRALPLVAFKCPTAQICVLLPLKVKELLDLTCLEVSRVRCYIFTEANTLQFVPMVIDRVRHAKQH
jgi:hypothetical protein